MSPLKKQRGNIMEMLIINLHIINDQD